MSDHVSRLQSAWINDPAAPVAVPRLSWTRRLMAAIDPSMAGLCAAVLVVVLATASGVDRWTGAAAIVALAATLVLAVGQWIGERQAPVVVIIGSPAEAERVGSAFVPKHITLPLLGTAAAGAETRTAATWAEALRVVATRRTRAVVLAGSPVAPEVQVRDVVGRRPAILTGLEAIQRQLGIVPLDLVGQDRWFLQLGAVRPLTGAHAVTKRILDIGVAVGLGLLVLPLLPLIALAIRLDSAGPVFYSQTRVGLGGRLIRIYKFRSMRQDAERNGAVYAQAGDPRVTRLGRFMRLTRIDELPQLWNVLKGDMTLVGPRPERPEFTVLYEKHIPAFAARYTVKPGLTGWAQVRYQYASSAEDTARKLEFDLFYLKHTSLWLDLRILFETIGVVLRKAGC